MSALPMDDPTGPLSDDERRRMSLTELLFGLGAGLGSAKKGQLVAGFTQGGLLGAQNAQQAVNNAMKQRGYAQEMQLRQMDINDRKSLLDARQTYFQPGHPDISPQGPMPDGSAMPVVPASPGKQDWQGYQGAIAGINPAAAVQLEPFVRRQMARAAVLGPPGTPAQSYPPPNAPPPQQLPSGPPAPADSYGASNAPPPAAQWAGTAGGPTPAQSAWMQANGAPPGLGVPQAPQQAPQAPQGPTKGNVTRQYSEKLLSDAQKLRDAGLTDEADAATAKAIQLLPQVKEFQKGVHNGQPAMIPLFTTGERGDPIPYDPGMSGAHWTDDGKNLIALDQSGKEIYSRPKQMSPGEAASNSVAWANHNETVREHNLMNGIDESGKPVNVEAVAKAIAHYDQAPLSSFAMGKPYGGNIMAKVMEFNPEYDAKNYGAAVKTMNAFSAGKEGGQVRSFNVGLQHVDTLEKMADALNNGNTPLYNKLANAVSQQTGNPATTNFNTVKQIVSNEIVKAIVGAGGGVGDRDKAQQVLDAAGSPAQLKGALAQIKVLMGGQLNGLRQQYETGTQRKDFDRFLSPEARAVATKPEPVPSGIDALVKKYTSGN